MEKETYKVMGLELALPAGRANEIEKTFMPFDIGIKSHLEDFNRIVNAEISEDLCKEAKTLRLKISKIRTGSEKARKEIKGDVLQLSKAIDSVGKLIKDSVAEKEDKLKEIETHYERIEAERKENLKSDRMAELEKYNIDGSTYGLENMEKTIWKSFLAGQKSTYEADKERKRKELLDRLEADKKKEIHEERKNKLLPFWNFLSQEDQSFNFGNISEDEFQNIIFDAETKKSKFDKEQDAIKVENDRLRKEQAEKDRIVKIEHDKQQEKLKKEREEKQELERELRSKKEAERKEQERIKAEELAREQAPDKEKLITWLDSFYFDIPDFNNEKFDSIALQFLTQLDKIKNDAKNKL